MRVHYMYDDNVIVVREVIMNEKINGKTAGYKNIGLSSVCR